MISVEHSPGSKVRKKKENRKEMKIEKPESEVKATDQITCQEAGKRGGTVTRDRYAGTDFYRRIGAKGGKRQKELYADLLAEFGRLGGRPRRPVLEGGEQKPQ